MSYSFSSPSSGQLKILLIDDEEDVLLATQDYLSSIFSIEVDTAISAPSALLMLADKKYDTIICDYEMKMMNGIDLLKRIRKDGNDTPFIIFTGKGREEVAIAAFENGADGYIVKGGEIKSQFTDLVHKITSIVEKHRAEKALREIEDKFKNIYLDSPIAIAIYDEFGHVVDINPAFADLFGLYSVEDIRNVTLFNSTNIAKDKEDLLKNGETIRIKSRIDFDYVRNSNLFHSSRSGKINIAVQITPMFYGDYHLSGYLTHITDITKEVQAEKNLREQKRFLDQLLETIPCPVFYKDSKGRYTGCNRAFEKSIGYLKEEIIGKTSYDIQPEELADIYFKRDKELFIHPGVQSYESKVRYADGKIHDVIFEKATLINEFGKIEGLIGIALDITERKYAEDALQKSEQYIRTILDNLPIGIAVHKVRPEGGFEYYNDNFLKIYRIEKETLKEPESFWDKVFEDPVSRPGLKNRINKGSFNCNQDQMYCDDIPISRKGDELAYINVKNIPIPDRNLMITTVWDITDRKRAEDSLRDTNRLLEGMLDGIPDIIGIQKPNHEMIRYNRAGYEILGLSYEEIVNKPCYSFIGKTLPCEICATSRALQSRKIETIEKFVPELKRYFICRSNPILDDSGNVQLIVEQLSDITERKQMEEAIKQSNQKIRLLTGLTRHDILNYLTAIHAYHEFSLDSKDPEQIHQYISKAHEAGKRIQAIIGFTREYENFGVASSGWQKIAQIIESAKKEISPGSITIENEVPKTLEVYADPIIRKVFTTLLENAIRHGKKVTQIRFSVHKQESDLKIICEDDGVGILPDQKNLIFKRGFGENTGIGLFLAREILSITELSINESGTAGEGARFEILVPDGKWRLSSGDIGDIPP